MSETPIIQTEAFDQTNRLFDAFMANEPTPILKFVPDNAAEQKALFLKGTIVNPDHSYNKLEAIDFDEEVMSLGRTSRAIILAEGDLKPAQEEAYREMSDRFIKMTQMMQAAHAFKHAASSDEKALAKADFMQRNIEVYGEPNEATYRGIMRKRILQIQGMNLDENGQRIRDELFNLIDVNAYSAENSEVFEPSAETVAWMHETTLHLYGPWLECIPEGVETFDAEAIREVFQDIIDTQFAGAAEGWKVVVRAAQSVNVRTPEKEIIIPPEKTMSLQRLKELICHEIGVHALRSIIGEQTDSPQLRVGTASYYDADEGLGVVVEDAFNGVYKPHGENYYVTAGLPYFEGTDFRQTFEIISRMNMLLTAEGKTVDDGYIEKKRAFSYGNVMRIMRGTDELPWFKDLGYYNGAQKVWKFLEKNRGDDTMFMFLISMGKIDPDNPEDRLLALEAKVQ